MDGATSNVGTKTYYVYDRTGTLRPVSTRAYYVKELNQDLLADRGLTMVDYRVILDKYDSIAGIYPVSDDGTIDLANSFPFPFYSEYSECLFYFPTEPIDASKYSNCRSLIYGIEDLSTVPTKLFAKQFHTQTG
jgi:hypothetical protein